MEWKKYDYGYMTLERNPCIIILIKEDLLSAAINVHNIPTNITLNPTFSLYAESTIEAITEHGESIFEVDATYSYKLNLDALKRELEAYVRSV